MYSVQVSALGPSYHRGLFECHSLVIHLIVLSMYLSEVHLFLNTCSKACNAHPAANKRKTFFNNVVSTSNST